MIARNNSECYGNLYLIKTSIKTNNSIQGGEQQRNAKYLFIQFLSVTGMLVKKYFRYKRNKKYMDRESNW